MLECFVCSYFQACIYEIRQSSDLPRKFYRLIISDNCSSLVCFDGIFDSILDAEDYLHRICPDFKPVA